MKKFIRKAINPLRFFISEGRTVGVLLLFCTAISLYFANAIHGDVYRNFWNHEIPFWYQLHMPHSVGKWINDLLMAVFFLMAGMEIKREIVHGELSNFKRAILPFGAALGGMVVPALIFLCFNRHSGFSHGWGIPTATDIAFSLGISSLFGKRVPSSLKIFLMALAIIDDLGAIIVIAIFYGGSINLLYFILAAICYGLLWICNRKKMKPGPAHLILSLLLWYCLLNSGIEASISGVLIAFAMPVNSLAKMENLIHNLVNFFILPLFALANTAVLLPADLSISLNSSLSLGVIAGLVIGKPLGIFLFSRVLCFFKIASLPRHTYWNQLIGTGMLAGIGFTMSIFTTNLALHDDGNRDIAKIAILASMVLSTVISGLYLASFHKWVLPKLKLSTPDPVMAQDIALG